MDNYEKKYLKYKIKYLTLKEQYGSSPPIDEMQRKRLSAEAKQMSDKYSFGQIPEKQTDEFIITRKADNLKFNVILNNFPLGAPIITCNNKKLIVSEDWKVSIRLLSIFEANNDLINEIVNINHANNPNVVADENKTTKLNKSQSNQLAVLLYCDPHGNENICDFDKGTLSPHWWGLFNVLKEFNLSEKFTGTSICETIDNAPNSKASYQEDGFSNKFIELHLEKYDLVMVPDCAGPWYELQMKNNIEELIKIATNLTNLLTPNGVIIFSKFISFKDSKECTVGDKKYPSFLVALSEHFKNRGMTVNVKKITGIDFMMVSK